MFPLQISSWNASENLKKKGDFILKIKINLVSDLKFEIILFHYCLIEVETVQRRKRKSYLGLPQFY